MKISCACGSTIADNTDFLSNKARLIADQDWFDVLDAPPSDGSDASELSPSDQDGEPTATPGAVEDRLWRWSRNMWQCTACGRMYVEDHGHGIHGFVPIESSTPRDLLRSIHRDTWKRPLVGSWRTWITDAPRGELWWGFGDAESGFEHFERWDQLERRYYEVFQRLLDNGILRSAFLRNGDRTVHEWPRG